MRKMILATLLGLGMATPALAYSTRVVEFDPAAELARHTGSAQYPDSSGGIIREARIGRGGSEAYPQPTSGVPHNGTDVIVGGSSRYPVLTQDMVSHPPTALSQDQVLTEAFHDNGPPPVSFAGSVRGDADADG